MCLPPHPVTVLLIATLEVNHPVTEGLKSVRGQLLPNGRDVTIKKSPSNLIKLTAHAHLASQSLQTQDNQYNSKPVWGRMTQHAILWLSLSPSAAQPESAPCGPIACWNVQVLEGAPPRSVRCRCPFFYGSHPGQITWEACSECPVQPGWCTHLCWCFHQIHLAQRRVCEDKIIKFNIQLYHIAFLFLSLCINIRHQSEALF